MKPPNRLQVMLPQALGLEHLPAPTGAGDRMLGISWNTEK